MSPGSVPGQATTCCSCPASGLPCPVGGVVGVYGGPGFEMTYPNGDRVASCVHQREAIRVDRRPWTDRTFPDGYAWWDRTHRGG